jgi:DNA polymerase-1
MKEIVLDLETDGLLNTLTKVHCLVYKADDLITVATTEEQILKALDVLLTGQIIGHNVLGFDLEVLKRLYGFEVPVEQVTDTLILSRLIHADLRTEDSKVQRLEPKYFGSHSLKAWGYRLDNNKGDYGSTENAFEEL